LFQGVRLDLGHIRRLPGIASRWQFSRASDELNHRSFWVLGGLRGGARFFGRIWWGLHQLGWIFRGLLLAPRTARQFRGQFAPCWCTSFRVESSPLLQIYSAW